MDGQFYVDSKEPFPVTSGPTITLTTNNQFLAGPNMLPLFPPNYFNYIGKMVRWRWVGQCTSGATPGTLAFDVEWGPATNATGTIITGVNFGWAANQANATWLFEGFARCRSLGSSGSLFAGGWLYFQSTGIFVVQPTSPAAVTCDLTQSYYIIPQCNRSGSTAETIQLHDAFYEAVN